MAWPTNRTNTRFSNKPARPKSPSRPQRPNSGQRANYSTTAMGTEGRLSDWWALSAMAMKRAHGRCEHIDQGRRCTRVAKETHHIVPLSRGGANKLSNLMCLCQYHHDQRHDHLWVQKNKQRGFK